MKDEDINLVEAAFEAIRAIIIFFGVVLLAALVGQSIVILQIRSLLEKIIEAL